MGPQLPKELTQSSHRLVRQNRPLDRFHILLQMSDLAGTHLVVNTIEDPPLARQVYARACEK